MCHPKSWRPASLPAPDPGGGCGGIWPDEANFVLTVFA
jgi:hypothetical protein